MQLWANQFVLYYPLIFREGGSEHVPSGHRKKDMLESMSFFIYPARK
jgi:hypothetical protein